MKKNIKFVYFDAGNVLFDYAPGWNEVVSLKKLPKDSLSDVYLNHSIDLNCGQMEFNDVFDIVLRKHKVKVDPDFNALWEITKSYKPINETHALVNEIKNNYQLGILSNAVNKMIDFSITHGMIPNIEWDEVVDSSKIGLIKPNRKIYEYATEKSGANNNEILFIDDLKENVDAAEKCGWNIVHFDFLNPKKSVEEIKKII